MIKLRAPNLFSNQRHKRIPSTPKQITLLKPTTTATPPTHQARAQKPRSKEDPERTVKRVVKDQCVTLWIF